MRLIDAVQTALHALSANRLRSGLTTLGMVIGVSSVIVLIAVGQGAQRGVQERIQGLGTNLIFVRPGAAQTSGPPRAGPPVPRKRSPWPTRMRSPLRTSPESRGSPRRSRSRHR